MTEKVATGDAPQNGVRKMMMAFNGPTLEIDTRSSLAGQYRKMNNVA